VEKLGQAILIDHFSFGHYSPLKNTGTQPGCIFGNARNSS
jgi:hypothetical protein